MSLLVPAGSLGSLGSLGTLGTRLVTHGIGGRTDLPLPTWLAVTGAVLAVLVSFAAISIWWPGARSSHAAGRPLPMALQRVVESSSLRNVLRAAVLAFTVFVVVVALTGPASQGLNLAPYAFYITFWVGLVPASLLLGPVWRVVNPLRTLHRGIEVLTSGRSGRRYRPLPDGLGWWPAAAWLGAFVWLELVFPGRSAPQTVGVCMLVYAVVNLAAAQVFGSRWFDRGDGFEAYSSLIATLSPFGRRGDGRLVVRNPVDGILSMRDEPGILAVVLVLVGSTAFDGLTRTRFWVEEIPPDSVLVGTAGLIGMTAVVTALYVATMAVAERASQLPSRVAEPVPELVAVTPETDAGLIVDEVPDQVSDEVLNEVSEDAPVSGSRWMPGLFATSLVPIAVGYSIAHYASLLLFEGQATWILLSDPYATGANYFGTRGPGIDYTWVSTTVIAYTQIGAIVLGHVVAVVVAHYRAVAVLDDSRARRSQYPLTVLMLFLTGMAVSLLINT